MRLSVILGVCVVLCGAVVASAYNIPVVMTGGNISVGCERTPYNASYDEVDFYLTGMFGLAAGLNTDGTQARINIIEGRWTADATGQFWTPSSLPSLKAKSIATFWQTPTFSAINFTSTVDGATIWTNTAGGGGRSGSGNLWNFFSGSWYTSAYDSDLVYPVNPDFAGLGTDSTFIAALYVTTATPDTGIAFGVTPYSTAGSGKMSFTYSGGTVENVGFYTFVTPEPGTLVLLAGGLMGLVAYAWRKRK
jgi:hypothetical protein